MEEIKIDNKGKKIEDFVRKYAPNGYYFVKCGCGIFTTDYPFVSGCARCEFKYAGSTEQIKKWKKKGILMKLLEPKEIPATKREQMINEYEASVSPDDYDNDLYNEEDYNDIMGF